jgi:hypothetical protein
VCCFTGTLIARSTETSSFHKRLFLFSRFERARVHLGPHRGAP